LPNVQKDSLLEKSLEKQLIGRIFPKAEANIQFKITNVEWIPRPTQSATRTTNVESFVAQEASTLESDSEDVSSPYDVTIEVNDPKKLLNISKITNPEPTAVLEISTIPSLVKTPTVFGDGFQGRRSSGADTCAGVDTCWSPAAAPRSCWRSRAGWGARSSLS